MDRAIFCLGSLIIIYCLDRNPCNNATHQKIPNDHPIVTLMKAKAFIYIKEKSMLTKMHRLATLLHPGYKSLKFASFQQICTTHEDLRKEIEGSVERRSSVSSSTSTICVDVFFDFGVC